MENNIIIESYDTDIRESKTYKDGELKEITNILYYHNTNIPSYDIKEYHDNYGYHKIVTKMDKLGKIESRSHFLNYNLITKLTRK